MHIYDFHDEAAQCIAQLSSLFNQLPQKGLKEADCQKVCLLNALRNLENVVSGVTKEDLTSIC